VTPSSDAALANIYDAPYTDRAVKTVALLASGEEIINNIARSTGLDSQAVKQGYKANYVTGTQIIEIKVTNPDTQNVTAIAEAIPGAIDNILKTIQAETDEKNRIKVSIAEQSTQPVQDNSQRIKDVGIILIFAAALGYGIFYLLTLTSKGLRQDLQTENFGVNPLGEFGLMSKPEKNISKILEGDSLVSEALREIRTNIIFNEKNAKIHTICVTSPGQREGKTSFIIALGLILSEAGKRVVIVDANLRSPVLSKIFSAHGERGLSDFFADLATQEEIIVKTRFRNLWAIPAGSKTALHPSTLLSKKNLSELKKWLTETGRIDYVLIDSPSINSASDATVIAKNSDAVIVLTEHGKTSKAEFKKAHDTLKRIDVNILGAVVSKIKIK